MLVPTKKNSPLFPALPKGNIGKGSVCPSVHPCTFVHHDWLDFLHIGHHDQVPWAANPCKVKFGSRVPNLSNYGNFFINFEFVTM